MKRFTATTKTLEIIEGSLVDSLDGAILNSQKEN